MATLSTQELVNLLKKASDAYYNTGTPILSDDDYDTLREELINREPDHPFLKEVGAKPTGKEVRLPFIMASLNKIKPGTGAVPHFVNKCSEKSWILSEKLDGISALWYGSNLFLRGDGLMGVDVTPFAPFIQGLKKTVWAVRGELITTKEGGPKGTLARSWVNGQLHQKKPIPAELAKIRFVAYEILNEHMPPREQFTSLKKSGFEVPWYMLVSGTLQDDALSKQLMTRRETSVYDTDGIVVAENVYTPQPTTVKNPTNKVAFKMLLNEQCAETTIVNVEWNPSAQGFLIPRLQVEPVTIGSARIEFVTAHNARFVVDNNLGKGAKILIKRSGDVIPAVERVIQGCTSPHMPTDHKWKWQTNDDISKHIILDSPNNEVIPKEVYQARLTLFAKTFDIPGLGPGIATKLVDSGLKTSGSLFKASKETLQNAIGNGNGSKLFDSLQTLPSKFTESKLMVASCVLPRGLGETKLTILFQTEPDPRKWNTLPVLQGWSSETLASLLKTIPPYETWRKQEFPQVPYPILPQAQPVVQAPTKGTICFTGVRDKDLEASLEKAGWKIVDSVSSKLSVLVIPDAEKEATGKVKKAEELGTIQIIRISDVKKTLGI